MNPYSMPRMMFGQGESNKPMTEEEYIKTHDVKLFDYRCYLPAIRGDVWLFLSQTYDMDDYKTISVADESRSYVYVDMQNDYKTTYHQETKTLITFRKEEDLTLFLLRFADYVLGNDKDNDSVVRYAC